MGLELGSKNSASSAITSPVSLNIDKNETKITILPDSVISPIPKKVEATRITTSNITSPALPPNLKRIMEGGGIIERMGAYLDAVRVMDRRNAQTVVSAFEALFKGYGRHLEMKLLMRSWAAIDPQAALEYASNSLDPKSEKRFGISEALAGWANQDPESALEWAKNNNSSDNPGDNPLILGVIKGIAEKNINSANEILTTLPEGNARWQVSTFLAQQYAKGGFEKAIEWAENFPKEDERMRETILGQMGARLARQDLSATAQWVKSMDEDGAALRVMDSLLRQWADKDANSASKWVDEIPQEGKRYYGMKQLTSRWALSDPIATAKWLNSFPPKAEMDPVVNEFVNRISSRDPEGAAGWALSITDPKNTKKSCAKGDVCLGKNQPRASQKLGNRITFQN